LWEFDTEREIATFRGHTHFVNSVSFNHDGTIFASGSLDQTVKLWFAAPDEQLIYRNHLDEGHVLGLAFSPSGNAVASSSFFFSGVMDRLHLWDPQTGESLVRFAENVGQVADVAFHPSGDYLAAGHLTGMVTIWDIRSGRLLFRLEGHVGRVWGVAFSPDGSQLASAGEDGGVNLWSIESRQLIYGLFGHGEFVRDLDFSPDGQRLATASDDGTVKVWEVSSGKELFTYDKHEGEVTGVTFSPDGKWVASTGGVHHRQGGVRIWDPSNGRDIHVLEGHTDIVLDAAFSPDGRRLATASDDRTIKLWDTEVGYEVFTLRGHTGGVISVRFSPDGRQIASGSVDRTVRIWENSPAKIDVLNRREAVTLATRGDTQFDHQEWRQAISTYGRAIQLGLDRADIHLRRGVAFSRLGDSSSSEAEFAEAMRVPRDDPRQLAELGSLFVRHGVLSEAVDAFGRTAAHAPDVIDIGCALGRSHVELGQANEAVEAFARAVAAWEKSAKRNLPHAPKWMETGWWIAGPFPGDLNTPGAPETVTHGDDRDRFVGNNLSAIIAEMADSSWKSAHTDGDGYLDLVTRLGPSEQETVYAREHVFSATAQQVALLIGWDDGIRLWVNGTLVFENRHSAAASLGQSAIAVTLQPGWNTILVQGVNDTGPHGIYVEISDLAKDRALAHMRRGELDRVLEVWEDAAESERGNPQLLAFVGDAFARRARWQEAADVFARLLERQPARNRNWVILAPLLVQVGDHDGYRRHCQRMLSRFGDTQSPMIAERTSKASLILPDSLATSKLPFELASRAVSQGPNHRFLNFFELAHGIACYRMGEYQSALEILERLRARDLRDPYLVVTTDLFLAMTNQKRNEPALAQKYLRRAAEVWDQRLPRRDSNDLGPGWSDWLICEIVRQEAEELLGVPMDIHADLSPAVDLEIRPDMGVLFRHESEAAGSMRPHTRIAG
jgi:WD40 repeat protein